MRHGSMMKQKRQTQLYGKVAALLWFFSLMSVWIPSPADSQTATTMPVLKREKMAVMPFLKGRFGTDLSALLNCPLCQLTFDNEDLLPDCDKTLTHYLQDALERRHEDMMVPLHQVTAVYDKIPLDDQKDTPLSMAQKLGRRLEADYVVVGTVWKYLDRRGGPAAVETPASVGFALYLVEVNSGILLWTHSYSETQQSLSENLLSAKDFFEMGAKWVTANELALHGIKELLKKFPF